MAGSGADSSCNPSGMAVNAYQRMQMLFLCGSSSSVFKCWVIKTWKAVPLKHQCLQCPALTGGRAPLKLMTLKVWVRLWLVRVIQYGMTLMAQSPLNIDGFSLWAEPGLWKHQKCASNPVMGCRSGIRDPGEVHVFATRAVTFAFPSLLPSHVTFLLRFHIWSEAVYLRTHEGTRNKPDKAMVVWFPSNTCTHKHTCICVYVWGLSLT